MTLRLRSALFTPGTRPERFGMAANVGADLLIIDLEDAVAPRDKATARDAALTALSGAGTKPFIARALRINGLDTRAGLSDLLALVQSQARPEIIVLPKTESATHLYVLDRVLRESASDARLIAIIESARALEALRDIVSATSRLEALMLGAADLAADLGCKPQAANLTHARVAIIEACALGGGIAAIDSPYFELHNEAGLRNAAQQAGDMGFAGMAAIHPSQVGPIHAAFTPSPEAVANARAVLSVNEQGVGQIKGQMVDEAVARNARRILAAADASARNHPAT